MLARDGGELEVHVAPVLPAAEKRMGRRRARGSVIARSTGRARVPLRERFVLASPGPSLVPSNDELFVGDVERARDVTVVGELHEPRDDGHLCFRSPRRVYRLDDAAVNGARSPRPRPKSLRGKASGGRTCVLHHEVDPYFAEIGAESQKSTTARDGKKMPFSPTAKRGLWQTTRAVRRQRFFGASESAPRSTRPAQPHRAASRRRKVARRAETDLIASIRSRKED